MRDPIACDLALHPTLGAWLTAITLAGAPCPSHRASGTQQRWPFGLAINTVLGNLKTAFAGTYHAFGFAKYAHRYLAQVQYLFNRRFNLRTILDHLVRTACNSQPCPLQSVLAAEHSC